MSKSENATTAQLLQLVAKFAQFLPLEADKAEVQKVIENQFDPFWVSLLERFSKKASEVAEVVKSVFNDMVAAGNYSWVNPKVTEENFPVPENWVLGGETKMFHFNRNISSENAIAEMGNDWRPATFYELLDYGAKNPEEQRKYPIVALGSVAFLDGHRHVAYLYRYDSRRGLGLSNFGNDWSLGYRFLAVRNKSSSV